MGNENTLFLRLDNLQTELLKKNNQKDKLVGSILESDASGHSDGL